jgi:aspartyl-tRNA(Asn)/glutamyl-tRNA(Gln) amidotransferase subunit C
LKTFSLSRESHKSLVLLIFPQIFWTDYPALVGINRRYSMEVNRDQVVRMAKLSRLELTDSEVDKMTDSMGQLMDYLQVLSEIDLSKVEPMLAVDTSPRPLRPDVLVPSLTKEQAFRNAPAVNMEHFSIPKVIG